MTTREFWDRHAAAFDDEPDHGLRDPRVRDAWARLLLSLVPAASSVVDLGCGTGSLSVLLAEAGHDVHGLDLSEEMVGIARAKAAAAGVAVEFGTGDAAHPPHPRASFGVVLARHVLWALPDPAAALAEWVSLLEPDGVLLLVEGRWSTGAGLTSAQTRELVLGVRAEAVVTPLTSEDLWGRPIEDERYLLVSRR
ncbi:class I SAM-dependent methyltransferase [Lentzea sp. NEAU-D7]|uniref:class I SAM-dependent methyltransferase n=1 Tax=Lentzea sp. NEAU-D7 TaxID=2994667 RepID=UPI00224B59AC|nr:class I SAM-dependent methyltransferase [Lentzea sp. NEAU-D7]MCX2948784.1 class I SAM-dependent methyltransferase [Lentzea sp. NEAU-D7]MCX2951342.1 class I SAM-dependent methyltransferase [Lentzea sp. NEAU-D7]